jgi:hypothetical protein
LNCPNQSVVRADEEARTGTPHRRQDRLGELAVCHLGEHAVLDGHARQSTFKWAVLGFMATLCVMAVDLRVLFCADPLAPGRIDPYFAVQADIVRGLGGQVAVIDHDALLAGRPDDAVRRIPRDGGAWWYRGWMIPSARYASLAGALRARDGALRVTSRQYRAAHELPGWYGAFSDLTAPSAWEDLPLGRPYRDYDARVLASWIDASSAIVKDFVKSRKHEWFDACFIPDLTDHAHVRAVVNRMLDLQGDDLVGGVVIRAFEDYRPGEARVWWVGAEPVLVTAHPDTPEMILEPDLS